MAEERKPFEYMQVAATVITRWRALVGYRMLLRPESPEGHPVEATLEEVTDRAFIKLQSPIPGSLPWWRHMSLVTVLDVMPRAGAPPQLSVVPGGKADQDAPAAPEPQQAAEPKSADVIPITRAAARADQPAAQQMEAPKAEPDPTTQNEAPAPPPRKPGRPKKSKPHDAP